MKIGQGRVQSGGEIVITRLLFVDYVAALFYTQVMT